MAENTYNPATGFIPHYLQKGYNPLAPINFQEVETLDLDFTIGVDADPDRVAAAIEQFLLILAKAQLTLGGLPLEIESITTVDPGTNREDVHYGA